MIKRLKSLDEIKAMEGVKVNPNGTITNLNWCDAIVDKMHRHFDKNVDIEKSGRMYMLRGDGQVWNICEEWIEVKENKISQIFNKLIGDVDG